MVSTGTLVGLFLITLTYPDVEARIRNLPKIISFLQSNYSDGGELAVVINVPAAKCKTQRKPDQDFLQDDPAWRVKHAVNSTSRVYRGQQLIAARPKPINQASSYHPEYLLLIQPSPANNTSFNTPLKKLLNKDKHGCVVFYTFNSPCVNTCSTPGGPYNLLPALDLLKEHKGPKAFVFSRVRKREVGSTSKKMKPLWHCYRIGKHMYATMGVWDNYESQVRWEENVMEINARVPLYRCEDGKCVRCVQDHEADGRCIHTITI